MSDQSEILRRYPLTIRQGFGFFFYESCPLSNWFHAPFTIKHLTFPTVEHYMMFGKARIFGDTATAAKILQVKTPREAKALGRAVTPYDDDVWKPRRIPIVATGARAKFEQHPNLMEFLLATEGLELVEASPYDKIWGIGLSADDPRATDRAQWRGEGLLGPVVTRIRDIRIAKIHRPSGGLSL